MARGFIDAVSSDHLLTTDQKLTVYCGFDPSADTLHVGNLVPIMGLAWFKKAGHKVVALVGGATGMIGDPSGKSHERNLLDEETIRKNVIGISKNLKQVLGDDITIVNNYDWFKDITFIDFLRDAGKFFRMGPMLSKDSVKNRLNSEDGMSFTEFCYQTLQGYDFLHLFETAQVNVQLGGSDQWGNITAGTDLIRKVTGEEAFGVTFPLLLKSDGQKFGKSEKGAVWLSADKLSPYDFYQYFIRVDDRDVIKLMRMLTFMEPQEIEKYEKELHEGSVNEAQRRLAEEVTRLVHGQEALDNAIKVTEAAKPGHTANLDLKTLELLENELKPIFFEESAIGRKWVDLIAEWQILPSKGDVKRLIKNQGLTLNNEKVTDETKTFRTSDIIEGKYLLIATGKKNKFLLRLKNS